MVEDAEKISRKVGRLGGLMRVESGVGVKHGFSEVKKGDMPEGTEAAYTKLRTLRAEARYVGAREKRAKAKLEEEEAKKK